MAVVVVVLLLLLQATAPPDVDHESKRVELYDGTESGMVDRMGHLREQTVAKNKEFLRQIVSWVACVLVGWLVGCVLPRC